MTLSRGLSVVGLLRFATSPAGILWLLGAQLALGLASFIAWRESGQIRWLDLYFNYPGILFFLGVEAIGLALCSRVWRLFDTGEALEPAWLLITVSAGLRLVGSVFSHILASESGLNPLIYITGGAELSTRAAQWGTMLGGPVHMIVLACGLFIVLRVYKRIGLRRQTFGLLDWVLLAIVFAYTARHMYEVLGLIGAAASAYRVVGWSSDPLLSILLLEAVLLRRSVVESGGGLIARCWGAFCAAIFLTSIGDMGIWAVAHGYLQPPFDAISWYVWFLPSAALALGPAYQLEAARVARRRWQEVPGEHRTDRSRSAA